MDAIFCGQPSSWQCAGANGKYRVVRQFSFVVAFALLIQAHFRCVLSVALRCDVLQVLWSIVELVPVLVIDVMALWSGTKERWRNETMDNKVLLAVVFSQNHHVITSWVELQFSNWFRHVMAHFAHVASIRNLVQMLVPCNWDGTPLLFGIWNGWINRIVEVFPHTTRSDQPNRERPDAISLSQHQLVFIAFTDRTHIICRELGVAILFAWGTVFHRTNFNGFYLVRQA